MDKEKQRTTPQASMKSKSSLRRTQKKANTCRLTITKIETYCLTKNITGIMGGATLTRYHLANKYKKMRRQCH